MFAFYSFKWLIPFFVLFFFSFSLNCSVRLKSRRHGLNSRSRSNSRQTKDELNHRQKNDINPKNFTDQKNNRKVMKNRNNGKFDLNRYRAQGIRHSINFNSTWQQRHHNQQWRLKQRLNKPTTKKPISTILPNTTMITTSTVSPPTTTMATMTSNDVNHYDERFTEKYNNKHVKSEFDHKSHSDILNTTKYQNEQNQHNDQTEIKKLYVVEEATNQLAIQTNEILDTIVTTTTTTTLSPRDLKKRKLNNLRNQLSKLSPEKQELFFKRRAERNRKRGITEQNITNPLSRN